MLRLFDAIRMRPRTCVMEITRRCNLRCRHCASEATGSAREGHELSLSEIDSAVRDLATLGCEHLILSGGEALLRDDWPQIAAAAVERGIAVSLISNGLALDAAAAKAIREAGISLVALSVDGVPSTHNLVRNHPLAYERLLTAAAALRDERIPFNAITAALKVNLQEMELIEGALVELGVNRWLIQLGSPLGRLSHHRELVLAPSDLPVLADFIVQAKLRGRVRISVGDNIGYYSHHEHAIRASEERHGLDFACGCSAGCLNVGIESNGNVKGCLSLQADEFIEGNIREESLIDIWRRPGAFAYTRDFTIDKLHGECAGCEYGELCRGGCSFMAYGATGRLYSNPYCLRTVLGEHVGSNRRDQL